MTTNRTIPGDWYAGAIPDGVEMDETAWVDSAYSFHIYRSRRPGGVSLGRGAAAYAGTLFDVGREGRVRVGDYAMLNGAHIICDGEIVIGDYALISWNVVLMDAYRPGGTRRARRQELRRIPRRVGRRAVSHGRPRPIRLERNVWIGFDSCILPGVTIGEGAIVGARSVVHRDVPPFTLVAGNPARVIRRLPRPEHPSS